MALRKMGWLAGVVLAVTALAGATASRAEITPEAQVAAMGRGINIIGGYDPYWWGKPSTFRVDEDFKLARAAGFQTVRIPVFAFDFLSADGRLDRAWLKRLDVVVKAALAEGFTVIIDEHDFDKCAADVDGCAVKLANVWYELSEHFQTAPDTVVFELLNEPHGGVDAQIWNAWLPDLIGIVRKTNPKRNIIVGPVGWNSLNELPNLKLPAEDRRLIVTYHSYSPFPFTHQGASWAGAEIEKTRGVRWRGTREERAAIAADFDRVREWSRANDRPIFLGEFGAYNLRADMADRAAWTRAVADAAEARGFAWAYWYWDGGFGVFDEHRRAWIEPIRDALLGPRAPLPARQTF